MYSVKEIYLTRQGEGAQTGRLAVFCRFSGCNLWSGREQDRAQAVCQFCDTDFRGVDGPGGGVYDGASPLTDVIGEMWPLGRDDPPMVVFTGGEPLLQLDAALIEAVHRRGFTVAVETNGTLELPSGVDWVCVSPKAGSTLVQNWGNELKLVYPQAGLDPSDFQGLDFDFFFLQPMDGPARDKHTQAAVDYCRDHPLWGLSLQTHKYLGLD